MRFSKIGLSMSLIHTVLAFVAIQLLLIGYVDAKSGVIDHVGTAATFSNGHGIDELNSMLVGRSGHVTDFEHAKSIIQRLDSSPICAHLATKRLLISCKSIKDPLANHESAQLLDNAKTVYAIRHAICQLRGAKSPVDDACLGIERVASTSDNEIELLPENVIKECLNFLSKNHFWTSYSNSLQDASALCDPARIDYQREELLNIYRGLTNRLPNIVEIVETHMSNLSEFSDSLDQQVREIVTNFEETLNTFLMKSLEHSGSSFDQLHNHLADMEHDSGCLLTVVHEGLYEAQNITADINDALIAVQVHTSAMFSELIIGFQNQATSRLSHLASLLDPIQSLLETGVIQQLHDSIKLSEHSISQFGAIQAQQTEVILQQNAMIANTTLLSKKSYDQLLAMNEALEILHQTMAPIVQTAKGVIAGASSFGVQIMFAFASLIIILLFPRLKAIAICFGVIVLPKVLQYSRDLSLHIGKTSQGISLMMLTLCPGCELGSYGFMLATAGISFIMTCLLLHWALKRQSRFASQALPKSTISTTIQELDRVHLSEKMLASKRAASIGPHF